MKIYRIGFKRIYALDALSAENALDISANDGEIDDYKYFSERISALIDYSLIKKQMSSPVISHDNVWLFEGVTLEETEVIVDGLLEDVINTFRNIDRAPYCVSKKYIKA